MLISREEVWNKKPCFEKNKNCGDKYKVIRLKLK